MWQSKQDKSCAGKLSQLHYDGQDNQTALSHGEDRLCQGSGGLQVSAWISFALWMAQCMCGKVIVADDVLFSAPTAQRVSGNNWQSKGQPNLPLGLVRDIELAELEVGEVSKRGLAGPGLCIEYRCVAWHVCCWLCDCVCSHTEKTLSENQDIHPQLLPNLLQVLVGRCTEHKAFCTVALNVEGSSKSSAIFMSEQPK